MAVSVNGSIGGTGLGGPASPGLLALMEQVEANRPAWMKDALCREYPEVSWFPDKGQPAGPAKAICQRCAVQDACQVYGLTHEQPAGHGIWGGLGPGERRAMRRGAA